METGVLSGSLSGALSGGGAEAIIGVGYGAVFIRDKLSILLDLTNNLSLFLQQIINPVPKPKIYETKLTKHKSKILISIIHLYLKKYP